MTPAQLSRLPRYARQEFEQLQQMVDRLESTLPWTKEGMDWFTLFSIQHPEITIFTCDRGGTIPVCTLGEHDRIFVGRGKQQP